MIEIDNLRLTIKEKEILKGISLHLEPGDIYGLLGPNGAGKSTTIFALLGLYPNDGGSISVLGGDPVHNGVFLRRSVGVMPEKAGFYDWMTATDYLGWYEELYMSQPTGFAPAMILEKVGLRDASHRLIGTYSRGMRQRLAVARALITRPRLLILDEPTNGLDPKGRREIHDLLVEFSAESKAGVLLCTHLLDDVDRLCNRIGIIDQGRTRLEGPLDHLLAKQEQGRQFRLRLATTPESADLPEEITLLGQDSDWYRVQTLVASAETLPALWAELWRRGWKIQEIRSETSSLEELYIHHTGQDSRNVQEAN